MKLSLKRPDLDFDFDIDFDLTSFALHFCLVFNLWESLATLHLFSIVNCFHLNQACTLQLIIQRLYSEFCQTFKMVRFAEIVNTKSS